MGAGMLISPAMMRAAGKKVGANDKIRVGLIGCNGMGFSDLQSFLKNKEVECVALADVDQGVLDRRVADVEKIQGKKPQGVYKDWRRLIDNKDVDVVIVGTPDHWHCLQLVAACEAGKEVYCENPLATASRNATSWCGRLKSTTAWCRWDNGRGATHIGRTPWTSYTADSWGRFAPCASSHIRAGAPPSP